METFRHEPIDLGGPAFRLIRLLRGRGFTLRCDIFQAWLPQCREGLTYEALSYVWGSTNEKRKIEVNGKMFEITKNLFEALEYLQSASQDRILWVDAICINQTDVRERGHQVQHMGEIYRVADRVIYWLGLPTYHTNTCLQSLRQLQEETINGKSSCKSWGRTDQRWVELWNRLHLKGPALQREGLHQLLDRPWFKRVWILQEVVNSGSAEVHCGNRSVSARIFAIAPFLMGVSPKAHSQAVLDIMPGPSRQESWWSQNRDLYTILRNFSSCEASDPRDLIYAVLGISSDDPDIQPEYDKSEQEVVRNTIRALYFFDIECYPVPNPIGIQALFEQLASLNNIALEIAAKNENEGDKIIEFILQHRNPFVSVTETALRAATKNVRNGKRMLEHLFRFLEQRPPCERTVMDTSNLIQAAAEIEVGGDEALEFLLRHKGHQFPVTDKSLEAAAGNRSRGKRLVELIFQHREQLEITNRVVSAAAGNKMCGDDIIELLLQRGYNPMNGIAEEILERAARNQSRGKRALEVLLRHGRAKDRTLLPHIEQVFDWVGLKSQAAQSMLLAAANDERMDILHLLLDWIGDAEMRSGEQLLTWACWKGRTSLVQLLFTKGVDVNMSVANFSGTPLENAIAGGHENIVEALLARGALIDMRDYNGQTPLGNAVQLGNAAMVEYLLKKGKADVNAVDSRGYQPVFWAIEKGHEAIAKVLCNNRCSGLGRRVQLWSLLLREVDVGVRGQGYKRIVKTGVLFSLEVNT